jgi:hypothetical protein
MSQRVKVKNVNSQREENQPRSTQVQRRWQRKQKTSPQNHRGEHVDDEMKLDVDETHRGQLVIVFRLLFGESSTLQRVREIRHPD